MKINFLYDFFSAQPYGNVLYHGGGAYGVAVAKILLKRKNLYTKVKYFFAVNKRYIISDNELLELFKDANVEIIPILDQKEIVNIIIEKQIDIFFSPVPYYLADIITDANVLSSVKIKGTLHGLRNLEIYRDSKEIYYRKGLINQAKAVYKYVNPKKVINRERKKIEKLLRILDYSFLTQTVHTKYSVISHFPYIDRNRIFVDTVFPDYLFRDYSINIEASYYNEFPSLKRNRYFLLVGGGRREKNLVRACEAMTTADYILPDDVSLVATGVPDYLKNRLLRNKSVQKRCFLLGYVDSNSLDELYKNCYALLYPSLSEGLGYPPLEAFKYKKPVLASAVTAIPVFYGESVIYFNPYDIYEMANRLCYIMDKKDYNEYSRRGYVFYNKILKYVEHHNYDDLFKYLELS
ncbi:glycosyltransferase [Spirochaetia bacterium 38H-sp]|uniref:Glycosyltransferase n=1 Tax=Rarispira pelagica TaxID=3141764 RepID=A0ABU9U9X3_9SPIR